MKDRQFMTVLALVVAAGLVMGLVAFRMTGGAPEPAASAAVQNSGAPHPSPADEMTEPSPDNAPEATVSDAPSNSEPTTPATEPPEMQGPTNGDPPGTAAVPMAPPEPPVSSPSVMDQ